MLVFNLSITERIEDNTYNGGHFFKFYITHTEENINRRIECYNDNYPLDAILKLDNIYNAINIIKSSYVTWKEKKEINEKLKKIEIVEDIRDYISKVTIK